jgi:hypothetical protein
MYMQGDYLRCWFCSEIAICEYKLVCLYMHTMCTYVYARVHFTTCDVHMFIMCVCVCLYVCMYLCVEVYIFRYIRLHA